MKLTKQASSALNELLEECENDLSSLLEEYEHCGFCTHCGSTQSGVEPDATDYRCEDCGQYSVSGLETVLLLTI